MAKLSQIPRLQRLRHFLQADAWTEPFVFMALFHLFVWFVSPHARGHSILVVTLALVAIPFASVIWHRESLRTLGLRLDNLASAVRRLAPFTLAVSAIIIAIGAWQEWPLHLNGRTLGSMARYLPWAIGQQFVLQCFVYRRLRRAFYPGLATVIAASLFGTAHLPNPLLTIGTALVGYGWCRLYERTPNLLAMALSQAWLATLLSSQVPFPMTIGPRF